MNSKRSPSFIWHALHTFYVAPRASTPALRQCSRASTPTARRPSRDSTSTLQQSPQEARDVARGLTPQSSEREWSLASSSWPGSDALSEISIIVTLGGEPQRVEAESIIKKWSKSLSLRVPRKNPTHSTVRKIKAVAERRIFTLEWISMSALRKLKSVIPQESPASNCNWPG